MKAVLSAQELEAVAAIPETAAGAALIEVLKREKEAELEHALSCTRAGKKEMADSSLQRAATIDEIYSYLRQGAKVALERAAK